MIVTKTLRLLGSACAVCVALAAAPATSGRPPRKVIVGTVVQRFGRYPGLDKRLAQLAEIVDRMAGEAQKKYGRGLDVVVLPETAVTAGSGPNIASGPIPFEGPVKDVFVRKAREHRCYIVVPLSMVEDARKKLYYNAAILIGRQGEVTGVYRKVHVAVETGSDDLEDGITPGKEVPVFECDFGKLGIQICFDMEYDYGWSELARKGADLVVWPTASPQTAHPAFRAKQYRYYIVSSPHRDNATIFEPTGKITAQVKPPEQILVQEIDLSYAILPWSSQLQQGEALRKIYGDRVGFRYYSEEDCGIFWSNDPHVTIGQMIRSAGLAEAEDELSRIGKLYHKAGVAHY
jgi:predicted amidohydrolase